MVPEHSYTYPTSTLPLFERCIKFLKNKETKKESKPEVALNSCDLCISRGDDTVKSSEITEVNPLNYQSSD